MLIVAQSIIVYRCVTYFVCTELSFGAWLATATQLLHGIGFSMTWSAGALQADHIAPANLKSSAQGLLNMAFNGLGSGLGAIIGGYIYEHFGAKTMWIIVAIFSFISILLFTSRMLRVSLFFYLANLVKAYKQ
jgi:predicted MFS family arabinose efflux permease